MRAVPILGIAGGSGSGKTTLARRLVEALGPEGCVAVLAQDSYYIDQSARFDGDGGSVNFDHPGSLDFALLALHLDELSRGRPAEIPVYDFATHARLRETRRFDPARIVIVEGTLILSQPEIVRRLDGSVFIRARENVRYERRLRRDVQERGREPEGVRRQFELQVKPMHDQFVEPSAALATRIVSGETPIEESLTEILQLARGLLSAVRR